jgi:hypothetical protein
MKSKVQMGGDKQKEKEITSGMLAVSANYERLIT